MHDKFSAENGSQKKSSLVLKMVVLVASASTSK